MGCCRHGVILRAVNMFRGETFRHTNFIHKFMAESDTEFISSDVICKYWNFARKVSDRLSANEINDSSNSHTNETRPWHVKIANMKPFLPRMHAKAHVWYCQVRLLLNGFFCGQRVS